MEDEEKWVSRSQRKREGCRAAVGAGDFLFSYQIWELEIRLRDQFKNVESHWVR